MVFHARQHRELNPSHHVGPDATSHRPLTVIIILHFGQNVNRQNAQSLREKIAEIGYFAEMPAAANVGGRRKRKSGHLTAHSIIPKLSLSLV